MGERQPRVAQEVECQLGMATDASTAATKWAPQFVEIRRAEVGKLGALDVAPDRLHGIELRRIPRQALDGQPPPLTHQVIAHRATSMSWQAVPDQHHRRPLEVTAQL